MTNCELTGDQLLQEMNQDEQKIRRQAERIANCGKWAFGFDPHNGQKIHYVYRCGLWRQCQDCLTIRAEQEKKNLSETYMKRPIIVLELQPEQVKKLVRGTSKKNYQRFPHEDFDYLFIDVSQVDDETILDGVPISAKWIETTNWNSIVNLPNRKNKSGTLFISMKAPSSDEKFSMINTEQIITDAPRNVIDEFSAKVIRETASLNPLTANDVEEALGERVRSICFMLDAAGYQYTHYRKRMKVIINKINWLNFSYNTNINNKTENYPLRI